MDAKTHSVRRESWRQIIREFNSREPGVNKKDWLLAHNISIKSFYY